MKRKTRIWCYTMFFCSALAWLAICLAIAACWGAPTGWYAVLIAVGTMGLAIGASLELLLPPRRPEP